MKRYLLIGVVMTCGLFWLTTGAPACGGDPPSDNEPTEENCDLSDPKCLATREAEAGSGLPIPDPVNDPIVKDILFQDPAIKAIKAITGKRMLDQDMWIIISHLPEENAAGVMLYFNPPFTYQGPVRVVIDPCSGKAGPDEKVDKNDPCRLETRGYKYQDVNWEPTFELLVLVDLGLGEVVDLFRGPQPPDASEFPFFPSSAQ